MGGLEPIEESQWWTPDVERDPAADDTRGRETPRWGRTWEDGGQWQPGSRRVTNGFGEAHPLEVRPRPKFLEVPDGPPPPLRRRRRQGECTCTPTHERHCAARERRGLFGRLFGGVFR